MNKETIDLDLAEMLDHAATMYRGAVDRMQEQKDDMVDAMTFARERGMTLRQIALATGFSHQRVGQILARSPRG